MKTRAVTSLLVAFLMVILAWVPNGSRAPPSGQDTLIIGVQNDTPNLSPWEFGTNTIWKSLLWRQWVCEGLYGINADFTYYPVLASSSEIDLVDPFALIVHLRQGVTFTDGTQMNATDVLFSYQTLAFNGVLSSTILKSIVWPTPMWPRWNASASPWGATHMSHVGIERIDDYTVEFRRQQDYAMFVEGTLNIPIMPAHIWEDHLVPVDLSRFVLPGGVPVTGGAEFDLDSGFGSNPSDVQATVGTGPWFVESWQRLTSLILRAYDGYWGKSQDVMWKGGRWPFFPMHVRKMIFLIYGTLDVAYLALKIGEVHVVPWNMPVGFYNDLKNDARMGFSISTGDGFTYLAFNMRKPPMDDINFRRAVSHLIDKDFIVSRLLGGYGFNGQAPITIINPTYVNSSALTPVFDLNLARTILDNAGYHLGSDGWRTMLDGSPLRLNILTPAKDYDPVMADTGIMISNNLKAIGLNVDSAPTAFDAIYSAAWRAVQFDMYILRWQALGPYPELYLGRMFECASVVENGLGDNTPGYCDSTFGILSDRLDSDIVNATRIQAAWDAESVLTQQLPYNTLNYIRNIEGYRADMWCGWTEVWGEILNRYSMGILGECPRPDYVPYQPQPASPIYTDLSSPVSLSVQVLNQGDTGAESNATLAFYEETAPSSPFASFIVAPLNRTEVSSRFTATWLPPAAPGVYRVACDVNYDLALTESNVTNNLFIWTIFVVAPPETTLVIGNPTYIGRMTCVNSSTQLDLSAVDRSGKGINSTKYSIDNASWLDYGVTGHFHLDTEGDHYLRWYSVDNDTNVESTHILVLRVDNTPPAVTLTVGTPRHIVRDPLGFPTTYVSSATPITLLSVDSGATAVGVNATHYRVWNGTWSRWTVDAGSFTLGGAGGTRFMHFTAWDLLGNHRPDSGNVTVVLDNTAPTTAAPNSGEFDTDTRFNLTANDEGCGVNLTRYKVDGGRWINYTAEFTLGEGTHTIRFQSVDHLGNWEVEKSIEVDVKAKSSIAAVLVYAVPLMIIVAIVLILLVLLLRRRKKEEDDDSPPPASRENPEGPKPGK